jgi:ATP-binding cassette subfamily B protein
LSGFKRIVAHFWPYIKKHRLLIVASLLALLAEVVLSTLEPWPLKFIFDRLMPSKHKGGGSAIFAFAETLEPATLLAISAVSLVILTGLRALADYANTVGFAQIGNRVLTEVRGDLYRHLHRLSLGFHTRARSGDLIIRVLSDVNMLRDMTVTAALPLFANFLILLGMIVVMFWMHWKLTLVALATLPLFWLWTVRFSRKIHVAARNQRHREADMASSAAETIGAIKTVQALCLEDWFAERFARRNREGCREDAKATRLAAALGRTVVFLFATSSALVLWYGAWLVLHDELSPGELLVFMAYLRSAFRPARDFAKHTGRLAKTTAAGERVLNVFEEPLDIVDLPGAMPAVALQGAVSFKSVGFCYDPGRPILNQIDLEVAAGQHIALVGASGIGKSTIVNLMLRLYDPTQGQIQIDNRDIREYTLSSLRNQISVVLQDTLLFAATVRDNITLGALGATPDEVEAAARLANAHDFVQALHKGYDTVVGERGVTLSAGQRQRIAIARAAMRMTPILILDEPTTGLDEENEQAVLVALERLAQGRTTFFITHDLRMAARADLILYLEKGRVRERGTHLELMAVNGRYAAVYQLQAVNLDHALGNGGSRALAL